MALQRNPDVPLSWRRPGTYVYLNLNSPGAQNAPRLLLLGERLSSGLRPSAALYRADNEQTVIDNSGRGSAAHVGFLAQSAQVAAGTVETWVGHVDAASSGTAAIWPIYFTGTATGSGIAQVSICGRTASVGFISGDTAASIATAILAPLQLLTDLPVTFASGGSGIISVTFRHKAAWAEDLPFRFFVTEGLGVKVGPGSAVYTTNATGGGTATLRTGRTTYTATITGGDTPTIITGAVTGLDYVVNGTDGPLSVDGTTTPGTLVVYFRNGWDIRRVIAKIVTSTGTTINWNGAGAIAAGTDSPAGTLGVGSPTLTTLLSTVSNQGAFSEWAFPWSDVTTVGTIDTQIETDAGGLVQKGQRVTLGANTALATAGAIPTGTTPALTATTRAGVLWSAFEAPSLAFEYACRVGAEMVKNSDNPKKNYNGMILKSSTRAPLLGPNLSTRSLSSDINAAIQTYFMAPLVWSESLGAIVVEHSRTTSNSADRALHKWSLIRQLDAQRSLIVLRMNARFAGTSRMASTDVTPFSSDIVTLEDFEDAMFDVLVEAEKAGYYDGADAHKDGIQAEADGGDPQRINMQYVATALTDVDVIGVVANKQAA